MCYDHLNKYLLTDLSCGPVSLTLTSYFAVKTRLQLPAKRADELKSHMIFVSILGKRYQIRDCDGRFRKYFILRKMNGYSRLEI